MKLKMSGCQNLACINQPLTCVFGLFNCLQKIRTGAGVLKRNKGIKIKFEVQLLYLNSWFLKYREIQKKKNKLILFKLHL